MSPRDCANTSTKPWASVVTDYVIAESVLAPTCLSTSANRDASLQALPMTMTRSLYTPQCLRTMDAEILHETGGKKIAWFGRASEALYVACHTAVRAGKPCETPEIILPAISCGTVATAAICAGMLPRFADVNPVSGLLCPKSAMALASKNTRAMVWVHLFGNTDNIGELHDFCRSNGIVLIEDVAQALGARLPSGEPVGSIGDLSIYSFGRTKILQSDGGALLVREPGLLEPLRSAFMELQDPSVIECGRNAVLESSYRDLQYSLIALRRLRRTPEIATSFMSAHGTYTNLIFRPLPEPCALAERWTQLRGIVSGRRSKAGLYSALLAGGPWRILSGWQHSGVCWRFSVVAMDPELSFTVSEPVRRDGFHVSNLYWPLNELFRPSDRCPGAEEFARKVVNLWVDCDVDENYVRACAASLLKYSAGGVEAKIKARTPDWESSGNIR